MKQQKKNVQPVKCKQHQALKYNLRAYAVIIKLLAMNIFHTYTIYVYVCCYLTLPSMGGKSVYKQLIYNIIYMLIVTQTMCASIEMLFMVQKVKCAVSQLTNLQTNL